MNLNGLPFQVTATATAGVVSSDVSSSYSGAVGYSAGIRVAAFGAGTSSAASRVTRCTFGTLREKRQRGFLACAQSASWCFSWMDAFAGR